MPAQVAFAFVLVLQAEPQPPPPPSAQLVHGYVYFDHGSDVPRPFGEIDPIAYLTERMPADVYPYVRGQTDRVGSVTANLALARRRAESVARLLVAEGVDPSRITLMVCNEAQMNRLTADEVSEPVNRFAWFNWGSQPPQPTEHCTPEPYRR
jgi:outer membrane protein OmpA-like peptidoglycan-associated protein